MQKLLGDLLLNELINGILFIFLVVLYTNSLIDQKNQKTKADKDFSMFILFCAIYIGLLMVWMPLESKYAGSFAIMLLACFRMFIAAEAYSLFACWLLSVTEKKNPINNSFKVIIRYSAFALFSISVLILLITKNATLASIPTILNFLVIEIIVLGFYKILGREFAIVMSIVFIPEIILLAQDWWDYTPANIYLTICIFIIYSRMWTEQKKTYLVDKQHFAEQKAELENARTKLVLSQIKPHFLFNTLSTITYLCTKNPELAHDLSLDFTTYLRGNLSALDSSTLVPFEKELEQVKIYLKIERVRFEGTLNIEYDIKTKEFKLPVLTVEPLVENAVKHGVCQKIGGGTITISTCEKKDCFEVKIIDDGVGFDVENFDENDKEHVGIRSVRKRMEILCGGTLKIYSSAGVGTTSILTIPKGKQRD